VLTASKLPRVASGESGPEKTHIDAKGRQADCVASVGSRVDMLRLDRDISP